MDNIIEKEDKNIEEVINKFPVQIKEVEITSIFPNKWNPNIQSDEVYKSLVNSVKNLGFLVPVLVRELDNETYEIIDGEHKYRAALEMKYTKILIATMGKIDNELAMTLTISMNNTRGQDDIIKRAEILQQIKQGQKSLFSFLPISKKEIEENLKLLDFDFSQFGDLTHKKKDEDEITKICKFIFSSENMLRRLHSETDNSKLKLLIENFFQWKNSFCDCVIKKESKLSS